MSMNTQGRPSAPIAGAPIAGVPVAGGSAAPETFTGNRALQIEEPLLFEIGDAANCGVDLARADGLPSRLGGLARTDDGPDALMLPGLSEPETMRHFVRLSQKNYAIDAGLYPLGSCTMKHNPRLNEKMARLPGFGDIHPLQPQSTVAGAIELIAMLADWLKALTGMPSVAMSPKAGAHGELCGMMAIKAALDAAGDDARRVVLVPESAHGTNPATAALLGFKVEAIPARDDGTVDPETVRARMAPDVAAIMLTNPNTCGLFEKDILGIADAVHSGGAYFYCDGANFNAIVGKARPGDLGVDAMHINLHKTFSTPHGGGGPGAGPTVLSARLAPFAPLPWITDDKILEHAEGAAVRSFGRMTAFHGQMGMFVRALAYMLSHGSDGMRQASEDAVLNANYVRVCLEDLMTVSYPGLCMHEVLFDDRFLKDTGISTLDFAKAMIDEGYHPMTMYFPLVVHGAMLVEPTESESLVALDLFIATLRDLVMSTQRGETERFTGAPHHAPRKRLDETRAARNPVLRWTPPAPVSQAAE
ncbi:MAG: aminomethyl-transferring glycine dehydrogenase subunit GcvPB [Pseudomonadota bacterium]